MARVSHPGVVAVHDYHSDGAGAFLVMQYVYGEPLSAHAAAGRPTASPRHHGHRRAGRQRAARGACRGHRAPGREAGQPDAPARRHRDAGRLRHRAHPGQHRADDVRGGARHAALPRAGAGSRAARDAPQRRLLAWPGRVRVPGWPPSVPGRQRVRDRAPTTAATGSGAARLRAAGDPRRRHPRARRRSGRSLGHRRRHGRRDPGRRCRPTCRSSVRRCRRHRKPSHRKPSRRMRLRPGRPRHRARLRRSDRALVSGHVVVRC